MRQWLIFVVVLCSTPVHSQMVPAQVVTTQTTQTTHTDNTQPGQNSVAESENRKLRVTLQADRTNAFVNEQILVTLDVGVPEIAFNLTGDELALNNVDVIPLNQQKSLIEIEGNSYQHSTTVFALFPREPGVVHIPALSFKAVLPMSANGSREGKGNPIITASTHELMISISSAPVSASSWFPAQNVEVASNWSLNKLESDEIRAGEPVTRHVTIKVSGQHPGAIPTFEPVQQVNVQIYPDTPQMHTDVAINGLNGTHTQSYAIVASQPGTITLPPIDINWWHIDEREWRSTTLPAEQLQIVASTLDDASAGSYQSRHYHYALAAMAAVIVGLSVGCVLLWQRIHRLTAKLAPRQMHTRRTEGDAWAELQRNIKQKNFVAIRQSIIQWASVRWPERNIRRLENIPLQNHPMYKELMILDKYLFSRQSSQVPDLKAMNKGLRGARKAAATGSGKTVHGTLSELYPG